MLVESLFVLNSHLRFFPVKEYFTTAERPLLTRAGAIEKYGSAPFSPPLEFKSSYKRPDIDPPGVRINHELKNPIFDLLSQRKASQTARVTLKLMPPNENIIVYDVEYRLDEFVRRRVENQAKKNAATKFVLALGDSHTFGEAVTTGQDYPSQLAKKLSPDYRTYNFGKPGFSVNDFLFRFQTNEESLAGVQETSGIAIWNFISAHLERFSCGFTCYQKNFSYIRVKPKYILQDNKPVFVGSFEETMDLKQKILYAIAQSETLSYFGISQHLVFNESELRGFVAALKEIRAKIEQFKTLKKFYFVNFDSFNEKSELFRMLEHEGFEIIDLSDLDLRELKNMRIPYDFHPTSDYYWMLSEILSKKIEP